MDNVFILSPEILDLIVSRVGSKHLARLSRASKGMLAVCCISLQAARAHNKLVNDKYTALLAYLRSNFGGTEHPEDRSERKIDERSSIISCETWARRNHKVHHVKVQLNIDDIYIEMQCHEPGWCLFKSGVVNPAAKQVTVKDMAESYGTFEELMAVMYKDNEEISDEAE